MIWQITAVIVITLTIILVGFMPIYAAYINKDHNDLL